MGLLEGMQVPTTTTVAVSAGACIVGSVIGGLIMKKAIDPKASTDVLPQKWVKVGEIKDLIIYPVKGIPGISVQEAKLANLGLQGVGESPLLRDRVFLIANSEGKCLSQGKLPMLALTRVLVEGYKLHLSHVKDSSMDITVEVPLIGDSASTKVVTLYGEKVTGVDCGDKIATCLVEQINGNAGFALAIPCPRRNPAWISETKQSLSHLQSKSCSQSLTHLGAFQDETSYMLMTDESMAALNAHLEKPVSHTNFRPTLVVCGVPEPFAEDFWGYIKIGQEENAPVMKTSLPCQRCNSTTVDPETGTFRSDGEPLRTLYRLKRPVGDAKVSKLVSKAAIMGAHFGVFHGEGSVVRVGDPVYAALV